VHVWVYLIFAVIAFTAGAIGGWLAAFVVRHSKNPSMDTVSDSSRVQSLTLIDDHGRQRALLRLLNDDVTLLLADKGMGWRARLTAGEQGSVLQFTERDVVFRLGIGILQNGSPGLELADPDGTPRASLSLGTGGIVSLALKDGRGDVRGSFEVPLQGNPSLTLFDNNKNILAKLP